MLQVPPEYTRIVIIVRLQYLLCAGDGVGGGTSKWHIVQCLSFDESAPICGSAGGSSLSTFKVQSLLRHRF